ncbi:MAG: DNA primase, partial [Alistipes sp.]|nr:DNA primase [Alistipes sp.]
LDEDHIAMDNKAYNTIFEEYRKALLDGRFPESNEFTNHYMPEVCQAAIDIITSDDRYIESKMWELKEVHTSSKQELLSNGVPKVVNLYLLKIIAQQIAELQASLEQEGLSHEETMDIIAKMQNLNKVKNKLSKMINRNII